jgi:hypothetical protein
MTTSDIKIVGENTKLVLELIIGLCTTIGLATAGWNRVRPIVRRILPVRPAEQDAKAKSEPPQERRPVVVILSLILLVWSPLLIGFMCAEYGAFMQAAGWVGVQIGVLTVLCAASRQPIAISDAAFMMFITACLSFFMYADSIMRTMEFRVEWAGKNARVARQIVDQARENKKQAEFNLTVAKGRAEQAEINVKFAEGFRDQAKTNLQTSESNAVQLKLWKEVLNAVPIRKADEPSPQR